MTRFYVAEADGTYRPATNTEVTAEARAEACRKLNRISWASPHAVREHLIVALGNVPHEVFCVAYLDNRNRLIAFREEFRGTVDRASVHPREIVKSALLLDACGVIFVHNHPSGCTDVSVADELITKRLKEALALLDVRVLDHCVVAGDQLVSFSERGLL